MPIRLTTPPTAPPSSPRPGVDGQGDCSETARDFLSVHLPLPLAICDFAALRLEPGYFVKPELRASHSDSRLASCSIPQNIADFRRL
ncbi:MAG: Rpn family recombination-promoting nuclease/putative transposase [Azoarcus sp.]|nr:Rpn family recombination-promoting nuclease/putative transposase [Azoarcus sp.]